MSSIGKHGDPTTTGGFVIATLSTMFDNDVRLAIAGDQATCGNCKGGWPISATGTHMTENGRNVVIDRDWVLCPCKKNRVIAVAPTMDYVHGSLQVQVAMAADGSLGPSFPPDVSEAAPSHATPKPTAPAPRHEPSTKQRCTLRIGVFFDGTGNNARNADLYAQCQASTGTAHGQSLETQQAIATHCEPYMLKHGSSYEGGYTNVWRLYQLYQDSMNSSPADGQTDFFARIYVEGIGTKAGKPDHLLPGYAFGTGDTGMIERVTQAITELTPEQIELFGQRHPDVAIGAIEFDVFGFSRGAAAARHFVNQINRKYQGPLARQLLVSPARFTRDFNIGNDVRIGFVGLFDTVVSRASLADGFDVRAGHSGPLHVGLPAGCARKVVQLVARDEYRANFMLTTVKPLHHEIRLPGAHSDIGGGYNGTSEGPLMLIEPIHHEEPLESLPLLKKDRSQSKAYRAAARQRLIWKGRLGNLPSECLSVDSWLVEVQRRVNHESAVKQLVPMVYATLRLERPIDSRYQLIPLRVMHKLAADAGVQWNMSPDDVPEMSMPPELHSIASKLASGMALEPIEEALLARNYLHQSAHWNFGSNSDYVRSGVALELIYPNRPECDREGNVQPRVELPNT